MSTLSKVIVIGLDGLEPTLVEPMLAAGQLPHLAKLRAAGGFARVATTYPAQTPVAWSTFATGTNPGGHGIFDFIRRNPQTYSPDLALNRYEQKNAFVPPKAVNLRRGTPLWTHLSAAGVASSIIRCPCTYPPDDIRGRMLSGMGVPDLRGGLGTGAFYTNSANAHEEESENLVRVQRDASGRIATHLIGPRNPKTRGNMQLDITIEPRPASRTIVIRCGDAQPRELEVTEGKWSDWLKVKFKTGMFQSVRGMVRFFLVRQEPAFELYASPVNFDAQSPLFPISHPAEYAKELEQQVGPFYTTGMVEDHTGLSNGRFDEAAYLQQRDLVLRERERMMHHELDRLDAGLLFCLFDTPDRIQHMFWRFGEPDHPANVHGHSPEFANVIRDHYRQCDAIVGRALDRADDRTLVIVLSDHGFNTFQRGMHLNTWLHDNGFLALKSGAKPGAENKELFQNVDWSRTKAYALGLSGIYLNIKGREGQGIVSSDDAPKLQEQLAAALAGAIDPARGTRAVNGVSPRQQIYSGPYVSEAPDLVVNFAKGYRVSWATALGGIPDGHFEDNTKRWSGDHIIDPSLVPGVLFMNRPFDAQGPRLLDMAPTILAALGVPKADPMEGRSLLL